jgi:actin-related protein
MIPTPILSIFSVGLTTGLVIESGDGITWVCPIINGEIVDQAVQKLPLAGTDVNQNLKNLLMREGINIESSAVDEIVKEIKERNCYFSIDPDNPPQAKDSFSFAMPDGSNIKIPHYIFHEAPEVLFKPQLIGYTMMNIPEAVVASLQGIDNHYWSDLLSHIVISGGNVSYSGFEERLRVELSKILPQLGKIPKPKERPVMENKKLKMQAIEVSRKNQDTCPHCGVLVDLSDGKEFCPSCGGRVVLPELPISPKVPSKKAQIVDGKLLCPHCNKQVEDDSSIFCPYCGKSLEPPILEPMVNKEAVKKTNPAREFAGYYESANEIIRFFVPESMQYAIFNGAAILGSLTSFQSLFITQAQFTENKDLLYKDISEIF